MQIGRSVRLFLAEGTPTGILTAEIVNWTGQVLAAPRGRLDTALKRKELSRTGIYILYGHNLQSSLPSVYVGEGDDIAKRLRAHATDDQKDYWDRFVAVTNKDMNLTKAHVKYLESRLISTLRDAKKSRIENKTDPEFDRLPEADISDMEAFLEELQLVLPVIGVDFFRKVSSQSEFAPKNESVPPQTFILYHKKKGIDARAVEVDGEFVLKAGSVGDLHETISFRDFLKERREQLIETGRARKLTGNRFELIEDVAFSSPSGAAVFLFGTSRNGRSDWLSEDTNKTYGEIKDQELNEVK